MTQSAAPTDLHRLFSRHGLRCTRQRLQLFEALAATHAHPTADELHKDLCQQGDSMSLATVYNTLEAFCEAGIAQKIPGAGGSARYDASVHNHLHLRDARTGQVIDAPDNLSQNLMTSLPDHLLKQIADEMGFEVEQVQIELVGSFRQSPTA